MSEILENENSTQESINNDGIPEVTFTLEVYTSVQAPVDDTLTMTGMAADAKATGDAIAAAQAALQEEIDGITGDLSGVAGMLFPVGSVYISTSATAPTFGAANWNWQEVKIPVTQGDLVNGFRGVAVFESGDDPGEDHLHFWLRIADTGVTT